MKDQLGLQHRLVAVVSAAAVSAMCIFGTVAPVHADNTNGYAQVVSTTSNTNQENVA